jgi:hypothetical protein
MANGSVDDAKKKIREHEEAISLLEADIHRFEGELAHHKSEVKWWQDELRAREEREEREREEDSKH